MKKLIQYLSNIKHDKLLHFFYGAIISFPLILFFGITGFIIANIIFLAKEIIYDKWMGSGNPDAVDFIYSTIPSILFLIIKLINI